MVYVVEHIEMDVINLVPEFLKHLLATLKLTKVIKFRV